MYNKLEKLEKWEKKIMQKDKFIWTVKVGDKGQIVIPKQARDLFNINNGDTLVLFGDLQRGIAIGNKEEYLKLAESIFNSNGVGNDDSNK